ncbi:MAG: pentapeptide repeat-containing protein [Elainellaceae cyanobacterium]
MAQDFQGQNLRGQRFAGQLLAQANFRTADIRGADFSAAQLSDADFRGARAGVPPAWALILVLGLLLLTAIASLVISFTSVMVIIPLPDSPFNSILEALLSLGFVAGLVALMVRWGVGATLGASSIFLAAMLPVAIAFAQYDPGSTAEYVIVAIILRALGLAGLLAGVITGSVIVAIRLAASNRLTLMLIIGLAALVAALGIAEATSTDRVGDAATRPFAAVVALLACGVSAYVGYLASQGHPKFRLVQSLAIFLVTLKGTRFTGADLTDADFTQATVNSTDLRTATLTRTRWRGAQGLARSRTWGTYLDHVALRQLVTTGQGQGQTFDHQDLRGLNLRSATLTDASFVGADLSNADLQDADLSRAKLAQAQLYNTRLNRACLTGAYIQDWGISLDTQFHQVRCDYIYMHLPTPSAPDPWRKPDNRDETFEPGDFADFITPIIKTLDLYRRQNVDLRLAADTYKTVDLFHHEGIDPSAAAIALKRLTEQFPEAGLEVVALEGRGNERVRLQARVVETADPSTLSKEYFEQYHEVKDLAYGDLQALLRGIEEKDNRIRSLENMVTTAIQQKTFYVETYQNLGDTMSDKSSININAGGDISNLSGIVGGNVSGVMNLGTISGSVTNRINQLPEAGEQGELKPLLLELQAAIEAEPELPPEDKAEALEQVKVLAEAGQTPKDGAVKKAAKTAMKILKGTTAGLSETTTLVQECAKLLPAISALLLLL